MTGASDFSDKALIWLAKVEHSNDVNPPEEVKNKLVRRGVADRADLGLKITGLGRIILNEARSTGLIPKHRQS